MASPPFFCAFLLFLLVARLPGGAPDLAADGVALLSFRAAVGRSVLPWNTSLSPCSWRGVACDSGRVTALRLPGASLIGSIPSGTVGNLSNLRNLSLRYNHLSGDPPSDIFALPELRNVYLQQNQFSGRISTVLSSVRNLVRLNLAGNQFYGEIPPALDHLTQLRLLYLESNQLNGSLPSLVPPNLTLFNVSLNQLSGSIPLPLRRFPVTAFLSTGLCDEPLPPCSAEIAPSPPTDRGPSGGGDGNDRDGSNNLSGGAIAGIVVGSAGFVAFLLVLFIVYRRIRKRATNPPVKQREAISAVPEQERGIGGGESSTPSATPTPPAALPAPKKLVFFGAAAGATTFELEDLLRASAEVLGKGTFGTSYKAVLEMGITVAVKRLGYVTLTAKDFRQKAELIGAMNHPNLLPLRAYYYSKDEKLLLYDYMPMGSLSVLLHGDRGSARTPLRWDTRTAIALDAARCIEYLHSTEPSSFSHGNITSSNILLSESYEARVSDHGLSLLAAPSATIERVIGYRAPEITDPSRVSQKADVYSFGVLLMELLTGRPPAQANLDGDGVDLPMWVRSVVQEERTAEVFDPDLLGQQNAEQEMVQLLQLAVDCAAQHPEERPSMVEVVARIEQSRSSSRDHSTTEFEFPG
ncbi:putative inactive receptor kinase At1g48480 [Curcuma longa]|uniref:putative inactive receptor kinase At1g48480 n=1 Tax=Curcuma longa TaxID=136217 RepID=UPI003D9FACEC